MRGVLMLVLTGVLSCASVSAWTTSASLETRWYAAKADYLEVLRVMVAYAESNLADADVVADMVAVADAARKVMRVGDVLAKAKPTNATEEESKRAGLLSAINQLLRLTDEIRVGIGWGIMYEGPPVDRGVRYET